MPETTGKNRFYTDGSFYSNGNFYSSGNFYSRGLRFSCKRCSACCRYESGFVFLSDKDVSALKAALKIGYNEFMDLYCRWIPAEDGKSKLSLKEKANYDCVFWAREAGCKVYEARPLQCVTFPFWSSVLSDEDSWEMTAKGCPGMNQGIVHSAGSIEKWLSSRQNEPIIEQFSKTGYS